MSESTVPRSIAWRKRLEEIAWLLHNEPEHYLAWRWRIEAKVLTFLLHRYGDSLEGVPELPPFPLFFVLPRHTQSPVLPHSVPERKATLKKIAGVNEEVHKLPLNAEYARQIEMFDAAAWRQMNARRSREARLEKLQEAHQRQQERERLFLERMKEKKNQRKTRKW